MKILIVNPRLCHGGAERVAVSLANGFVSKGYDVIFAANLFDEQTYELEPQVKLVNLVSVPAPKIRKWWSAIWIIRSVIKKEKPIVVIGIMSLCSIIARLAAIGIGIPVIATVHDAFEKPDSAPMSWWERLYKFYICKLFFRCVTVLTEADKRVTGSRLKNVVVMPNPLAITPLETVPPKKRVLLAAGRVDNWHVKGFDVLIRAYARVVSSFKCQVSSNSVSSIKNQVSKELEHETNLTLGSAASLCEEPETIPQWRLQIAGVWKDPKTREYLDGIAKECGVLDQIDYLGFIDDMKSLYQNASIFVLSSRYEGFGLVLIEAMSQGCACVACDYKGRQREIIQDDSQGLCCEPDNVEALAEGIKRMMEDEEYRREVQRNSIERSKAYSIEHTIQHWEKLLNQIVN